MLPHQERVIAEQLKLSAMVLALGNFIASPTFLNVESDEQNRLRRQYFYMVQYSSTLSERIDNFVDVDACLRTRNTARMVSASS